MRFTLIDRILDLQPGKSIRTVKALSLAEEYLQDHFPLFPVMPGVLMVEAMTQACAWFLRIEEDFAHSIVVLQEARNVKFANFVEPGQSLVVEAELVKQDERFATFKTQGLVDGATSVSARLTLERYNRGDDNPYFQPLDAYSVQEMRALLKLIYPTGGQGPTSTVGQPHGSLQGKAAPTSVAP